MKKVVCFVVFLTGVLIVLAPWLDGLYFKKKMLDLVMTINRDSAVKVSILEYRVGWLRSTAKIHIIFPHSQNTQPTDMTLDETITHGPIIYSKEKHKNGIAMTSIDTASGMMTATEKAFLDAQNHVITETTFRIARPLATQWVTSYFKMHPTPNPVQPPVIPTNDPNSIEAFHAKVANLMKQGKLPLETSMQIMELGSHRLTQEQFTESITRLKLTPSLTTDIIQQYAQTAGKRPPAPTPPPPLSPIEQANIALTQWEKQGYFTHDQNDYVITVVQNPGKPHAKHIIKQRDNDYPAITPSH